MNNEDIPDVLPPYQDHVRLWADELREWLPHTLFDAHVHLCPPDAVGPFTPPRRREALCTFSGFTWEQLQASYANLFNTRNVEGLIVFPLPLREVNLETANEYVIHIMKRAPHVKGFLLSHPTDTRRTRTSFQSALSQGVRFTGVKPYFDLLGKSNYRTALPEFIPESLLEFMDHERLIMMLHSSGNGMGVPENQEHVRRMADTYPNVKIILAHMGRYLTVEDFFAFMDSGLAEHPSLYLEMSSASRAEVYQRTLAHEPLRERLLFGSDLPFGLITGIESWSEETGPVFLTRDRYAWSQENAPGGPTWGRTDLTYNVYHTIKAFKDALEAANLDPDTAQTVKQNVFRDNARRLFPRA